jgi:hypothetical protein
MIAQEVDILRLFCSGHFSKRTSLFERLVQSSRGHLKRKKRWQGYSYFVPGWFQGKCRKLEIIGDKKGGDSTKLLKRKGFKVLNDFQSFVKVPIKCIHIIRNPFDNIATISKRHFRNDLNKAVSLYLDLVKTIYMLKETDIDIIDIKHEDFVSNPKEGLRSLCRFLGVDDNEEYLDACSSIVFKKPRVTRKEIFWPKEKIKRVQTLCKNIDFLKGYVY